MVTAWSIEQAAKCPDCGIYYDEFDPLKGGHIHAYYPKAKTCMGCKAKQDLYEAHRENDKSVNGLQVYLEKNPSTPNLRSPLNGKPIPGV